MQHDAYDSKVCDISKLWSEGVCKGSCVNLVDKKMKYNVGRAEKQNTNEGKLVNISVQRDLDVLLSRCKK